MCQENSQSVKRLVTFHKASYDTVISWFMTSCLPWSVFMISIHSLFAKKHMYSVMHIYIIALPHRILCSPCPQPSIHPLTRCRVLQWILQHMQSLSFSVNGLVGECRLYELYWRGRGGQASPRGGSEEATILYHIWRAQTACGECDNAFSSHCCWTIYKEVSHLVYEPLNHAIMTSLESYSRVSSMTCDYINCYFLMNSCYYRECVHAPVHNALVCTCVVFYTPSPTTYTVCHWCFALSPPPNCLLPCTRASDQPQRTRPHGGSLLQSYMCSLMSFDSFSYLQYFRGGVFTIFLFFQGESTVWGSLWLAGGCADCHDNLCAHILNKLFII